MCCPCIFFNQNSSSCCLISNREGLGTSLQIMGLATIEPHIYKVQPKFYKIPKFGVSRPKIKQDSAIWKCQNLQYWSFGRCLNTANFFVNFEVFSVTVKTSLINTKLGNFVNLGVLLLTIYGSIVANPIIYRLVPSLSRFKSDKKKRFARGLFLKQRHEVTREWTIGFL